MFKKLKIYLTRPRLAGLGSFFVASGITFVYILGAIMRWEWVCLVTAIMPTAGLILIWKVVPESPNWLVHHGKLEEARRVKDVEFYLIFLTFLL